jgi:hypothetical protein
MNAAAGAGSDPEEDAWSDPEEDDGSMPVEDACSSRDVADLRVREPISLFEYSVFTEQRLNLLWSR